MRTVCSLVVAVTALLGSLTGTAAAAPLIGTTYTHTAVAAHCDLFEPRSAIVLRYDEPGVRRLVRGQLAAMRAAGLQTIRILLWHMSNIGNHVWGVIPSANGRLSEPYRTNLIRFTRDIRDAGFERFTVHFGPQWANDPISMYANNGVDVWDPDKFDENWAFIRDARTLVKQQGPSDTRFDIASEYPPSEYQPAFIVDRLHTYMSEMWRRYVTAFGKSDVSISVIGKGRDQEGPARLANLVRALVATGLGMPEWWEIHPDWSSPAVFQELSAFDRALSALGQFQPIVVGESSYENPAVAADIARFIASSSRPVLEVYQWWRQTEASPCVAAPYRADAYRAALGLPLAPPTPSPLPLPVIPTLFATVGLRATITLKTADGKRVKSLDAGRYKLVVNDRSQTESFHLTGPSISGLQTGVRFRGRKTWTVDLGLTDPYGSQFGYGSDRTRSLRGSFIVR